mgnify:CR=1 FL=1
MSVERGPLGVKAGSLHNVRDRGAEPACDRFPQTAVRCARAKAAALGGVLVPATALAAAGVTLGGNYPTPIVDHRMAREAALAAYASGELTMRPGQRHR